MDLILQSAAVVLFATVVYCVFSALHGRAFRPALQRQESGSFLRQMYDGRMGWIERTVVVVLLVMSVATLLVGGALRAIL